MNLAELLMGDAADRGLRHFFGLPGGGAPLDLMEAGRRAGVDFVSVAHESTAGITAAYNGLLSGTAGLSLAVKGVGAGNLAGGAANAYFERAPVVCLCECSPTQWKPEELIQHVDHSGFFQAVVKYQSTLSADSAAATVQEAVFQATDGRPGPVLLNLPSDLARADCSGPLAPKAPPVPTEPDAAQLARVAELIGASRRVVIIAGADIEASGARQQLLELAENIGAAVLVNANARGVFPESHPRWAGVLMGMFSPNVIETKILNQADLVLLVGVDAMMTHTPWKSALPTCELVARPEYKTLSPEPRLRLDGDLKAALARLLALEQEGFREDTIRETRREVLRCFERPAEARLAAQDIIDIARAVLPGDGILISETGVYICMLEHLWPVDTPGTYLGTAGGRSMGLTVPGVLGAKLAKPETPMIGLGADGSLLMRLGELEVFSRLGVSVPLVIINDQALGTMKSRQKSRGLHDYGLDLEPVDLAAVAKACGLAAAVVETPEAFEKELKRAMVAERTTLIDARVDPAPYQDSFGPTIGVLS